jgi:hypothetical protein
MIDPDQTIISIDISSILTFFFSVIIYYSPLGYKKLIHPGFDFGISSIFLPGPFFFLFSIRDNTI